jgi:capsular exopolysaccharide synthesis family protein
MGLPILGAVPHIKGTMLTASSEGLAQLAEAFRELRFAILHAHGSAGPLVLSLSSPESGDGKSMVAANLATVFADQGQRVLLIDADVRRGSLHRSLGLRRTPGLTDYLMGRLGLEDVTHKTETGFSVILSGTRLQTGPELIGSPAMAHLIRDMRSKYSVIIVDTPPLSAGVDAYVLATLTTNLLLVLRTGVTDAQLAEAKLALLDRLPVRVLGALLNDVPRSRAYRYYSYASGYQPEDELLNALQITGANAETVSR